MRALLVRWVVYGVVVSVARLVVGFESTVLGLLLAILVSLSILLDPIQPRGR